MDSLRRLVHGLRVFDRQAEHSTGLSGAQLFVLSRLAAGGAASVNELSERTFTHQSSVSVVAAKLVERGLASKSPSNRDGRRVELTLSPAGRRLLKTAPAAAQEKLVAAVHRLAPPQQDNLAALLEQLVTAAGLGRAKPRLFFEEARSASPIRNSRNKTPHARRSKAK
jgi:DNA-binding MarR family transcriptional regulator